MKKNISFEEALKKLEIINEKLKNGEENLEDSLKLFEEGAELSAFCYEKLNAAQQRIEKFKKPDCGENKADEQKL